MKFQAAAVAASIAVVLDGPGAQGGPVEGFYVDNVEWSGSVTTALAAPAQLFLFDQAGTGELVSSFQMGLSVGAYPGVSTAFRRPWFAQPGTGAVLGQPCLGILNGPPPGEISFTCLVHGH